MASVYDLKPKFQNLLRPLVVALASAGITPNAVTGLAMLASIVVGVSLPAAAAHPPWLLIMPVWLFLRMALNAIDGMLAREHRMITPLGGVFNEVGDVASDIALYIPLGLIVPSALWPAIAFGFGAILTEFCGVLRQPRRYDGPMGKSDRAFVTGILTLAAALFPASTAYWPAALTIAAVLTLPTCWNRLSRGWR